MDTSGLRFQVDLYLADTPVHNVSLFERAWDECIELQVQPKDAFVGNSLLMLQSCTRWEIAMWHRGEAVGGLVLAIDNDVHVGECMSVFAQYVLPEYRNKNIASRCMREAIRITKLTKLRVLAYTHRVGDWTYKTTYRRIQ